MSFDKASLAAIAEVVDEEGEDLTNPVNSTGRPIPDEGMTRIRFIEYIEYGTLTTKFKQPGGKVKVTTAPRVSFGLELSGKNHPPMEFDGVKVPHVIRIKAAKGMNAKSGYIKMFKAMTGDFSDAKNFVALLGDPLTGTVKHKEFDKTDGTKGKRAHLGNAQDGFLIEPATYVDKMTEETKVVPVDEPIEPIRLFLWDRPTLEMWDSLYIEGTWDNGDVKNEWQERIKRAENFEGSPIHQLLMENGREAEVELQQFDSKKPAQEDPLGEAEPSEEDKAVQAAGAAKAAAAAEAAKAAAVEAGKAKVAPKATKPATAPKKAAAAAPVAAPAPAPAADPVDDDPDAGLTEEEIAARDFAEFQAAKKAAAAAKRAKEASMAPSKNAAVDPLAE